MNRFAAGIPLLRILLLFLPCFFPVAVQALEKNPAYLTIYAAQGVDSNLVDLIPKTVKGDLGVDDTRLYALSYYHPLETPEVVQWGFDFLRISNTRTGVEAVLVKHEGLQANWEADLAWQLRFTPWQISQLRVRPGIGLGLSYAFGTPTYEDGPKGHPERRYRLQNFNSYELEWSLEKAPSVALITRIHHRSGIYGLIAPPRVGSNFIGMGIRYSF